MKLTLIICTYKRSKPIVALLNSVKQQSLYPDEILVIDGSPDDLTENALHAENYQNLFYHKVSQENRGLTRQRNFGIGKVALDSAIVCFLDDDTVLERNYFEEIIKTYEKHPEALGVGGYITNEVNWIRSESNTKPAAAAFYFDGWTRAEGSRYVWRKKLGLDTNRPPGFLPEFSHGRSISFLPPSGKIYEVEQLMGGVSSFRRKVFEVLQFSTYFEGYGLYEDADFTLRLSKLGKLYVNTAAQLRHYHDSAGRPNKYEYGKMVVRNGWYVWRIKYPNPSLKARIKWHLITLLLLKIRFLNVVTTSKRQEAFTEATGRFVGWIILFFNKPKLQD